MTLKLSTYKFLEPHLQQKLHNRAWVENCLNGNSQSFPYQPAPDGRACVAADSNHYVPETPLTQIPDTPKRDNSPLYVVNIPMAHLPGDASYDKFITLLTLFKEQSFGQFISQAQYAAKRRIAIVIGVNQIQSIDPATNRAFNNYISKIPRVYSIAYRVFGFKWTPEWEVKPSCSRIRRLYARDKAYLLIKTLLPAAANAVRITIEGEKSLNPSIIQQIPFQRIRQRILQSNETEQFSDHFTRHVVAPIYYTVMDADCLRLRNDLGGVFSRLDQHIQEKGLPSAISLGYSVKDDEYPTIKFGVRIDMKVREAMCSVIPFSAYLPEPLTAALVREPKEENHLKKLSFLGDGRCLESRRLLQNGVKSKIFGSGILIADGGVTMATPGRMKTVTTKKAQALTPKIVKEKQFLKAVRGLAQSHAHPKQWADNLYVALGFSHACVTDVTKHLMYIFKVFDPISRMFSTPGNYSSKIFDKIMREYHHPLSEGLRNTLETARGQLYELGMPREKIDLVEEAARRSGAAIYRELAVRPLCG